MKQNSFKGQKEKGNRVRNTTKEVYPTKAIVKGVRPRSDHSGTGVDMESPGGRRSFGGVRSAGGAQGPARAGRARQAPSGYVQAGLLHALRLQTLH